MQNFQWNDKKILIVEDLELNRILIGVILETTKCNIIYAKSSEEFFDIINSNINIDLILMDIGLGEKLTGIDLIKYLNEKNINIPIIIQTAYDDISIESLNLDDIKYDFLIKKPIDFKKLLYKMNELLIKN